MTSVKQRALRVLRNPDPIHGFYVPYPRKIIENDYQLRLCFGGSWTEVIGRLTNEIEIEIRLSIAINRGFLRISGGLGSVCREMCAHFPFALEHFLAKLRELEADLIESR
jgi:hypothetical protein